MPLVNLTTTELAALRNPVHATDPERGDVLLGIAERAEANDDPERDDDLRDLLNDVPSVIDVTHAEYEQVQWLRALLHESKVRE